MVKRPPFRLSVDQYEKMIRHGILTEYHKIELIHGELVPKMPIGDPHIACVRQLARLFYLYAMNLATIGIQDPIRLADSEPEPDISVLAPRKDNYKTGKATPPDIYLVVEVADSSVDYDREDKGRLYAMNGIAEYWLANVNESCVEVYRDPQPDGTYSSTQKLTPGDSIALLRLPSVSLSVADIFGS